MELCAQRRYVALNSDEANFLLLNNYLVNYVVCIYIAGPHLQPGRQHPGSWDRAGAPRPRDGLQVQPRREVSGGM